jgi:hypothetical protein
MAADEQENARAGDSAFDSGIHTREAEGRPATGWQIGLTAALVTVILVVFFYGLTSQRQEAAGPAPPAPQQAGAPASGPQPAAATTGSSR